MSGRTGQGRTARMGRVPIEPHWLASLLGFADDAPRVVRASINLLTAAWSPWPAGRLTTDLISLALIGRRSGEAAEQTTIEIPRCVEAAMTRFAPVAA